MRYASLRQGLVGAWCPSVSGPYGYSLPDLSGYGNHGTLTNMDPGSDWVVSDGKGALDFDGSNDYVTNSQMNFPKVGDFISVSMWINWLSTQTDYRLPFGIGADVSGGNRGYYIWRSNTGYIRSEFGSSTGVALSPTTTSNNVWTHVAAVYNKVTNKLFLNGKEVCSTNYSSANFTSSSTLQIGAIFSSGISNTVYYTNCQMDDVRIYRRILTDSEIRLLASERGIGLAPRPRQYTYYKFRSASRRRKLITGMP